MQDFLPANDAVSPATGAEELTGHGTARFRQQMGQISRQSSVFFFGMIFTAGTAYVFKVYLARVLGADALGIYALGMTIVGFLSLFSALGLPSAAVRFVASYSATGKMRRLGGFLARSVLLLSISGLISAAIMVVTGRWVAVHLYRSAALGTYMGTFALIMAIGTMNAFFGQVLAGYKDVAKRTLITSVFGTLATITFTVLFVTWGSGLRGYLSAQVLAAALTLALFTTTIWKLTPRQAWADSAWRVGLEKEVMGFSLASFGMVFLQFLMTQADKILIGFYLNARKVGIYVVAMGLVAFVPSILQAVNQIFAPVIAELHARGDHAVLGRIFQTLTKWILGLTIPLIMMLVMFAQPVMRIFGSDFQVGWPVLIIGSLAELIDCGVGSVGFLLLMSGNERRLLRIQMVMATGIVALNVLLIPVWGIVGAAVASAVTNAGTNVWCLRAVKSRLGLSPYNRSYLGLLGPVSGSFVVLRLAHFFVGTFRPILVMGTSLLLAYAVFGAIALMFGLDSDDKLIAGAIWARLRTAVPSAR